MKTVKELAKVGEGGVSGHEAVSPLWTLEEVAAFLRVSTATVRRWTNTGLLPCYRLGGNRERRFSKEQVLAFVARHAQPAGGRAR